MIFVLLYLFYNLSFYLAMIHGTTYWQISLYIISEENSEIYHNDIHNMDGIVRCPGLGLFGCDSSLGLGIGDEVVIIRGSEPFPTHKPICLNVTLESHK